MLGGERKCNGGVNAEDSSQKPLITYKRRKKCAKPSSYSGVVAINSLIKRRRLDIGWEHGEMVDGNRLNWQCNWCGIVSCGGVTRLKRHLAGSFDVRKCINVPDDVSKAMVKHMLSRGIKRKISAASDGTNNTKLKCSDYILADKDRPFVDPKKKVGSPTQLSNKDTKQSTIHHYQSKGSTQRPQATACLYEDSMAKDNVGEHHDTVLHKSTSKKDGRARTDCHWTHWKYVLENMLKLPDFCEGGGGVQRCIHEALTMGHSGFAKKFKTSDINGNSEQPQDRFEEYEMHTTTASGASKPSSRADILIDGTKCQNFLVDILRSEKFALLCDLLWRTSEDNKTKGFFDFSLINAKMKSGDYGRAPGLFDQDIQQVWKKVKKVGQDMIRLAECLSNMTSASCQKQDGEVSKVAAGANKTEKTCAIGIEWKNIMKSNACNFDHLAKLNRTKPSSLHETSTSQQCGAKANGKKSHFSCPNSTNKLNPIQSSHFPPYCPNERESPQPDLVTCARKDSLNQNCAAYDKLEDDSGANDSRESSVSNIDLDEPNTSISGLCKLCGTCEEENKRFLVCGYVRCRYKFYHIRCLNSRQIASTAQWNKPCWLCPSCLCRACLLDRDGDKTVLCDGCDEAYHTYCADPPCDLMQTDPWYCVRCNAQRERKVLRKERGIFERRRISNDVEEGNESTYLVDLLLSAAEKLQYEENLRGHD